MSILGTESEGMDKVMESAIWASFEDAAPNLCYIERTRELLGGLIEKSAGVGELLEGLEGAMTETGNPSLRTDLKILIGRIRRSKSTLAGG